MRPSKRWVLPAMLAGAALAWTRLRRGDPGRLVENVHRYSAPTARLYDAVTAPLLGGFFTRVAGDLAKLAPQGRVLEVGSGPGRLAARLAKIAPGVRVIGVDIAPDMVERAISLAARSGVADRVAFQIGDVAALPFADASSTWSSAPCQRITGRTRPLAWQRFTGCCARAASPESTTWLTGSDASNSRDPTLSSTPSRARSGTKRRPARERLWSGWVRSR
jgi:SAM-dependent methyltransferase